MASEILIQRTDYIEKLKHWLGQTDLVKIVTGVRRCGKSKLLELFQWDLLRNKTTTPNHIISINLEDPIQTKKIGLKLNANGFLEDYQTLLDYILPQIKDDKTYYVFIDEIQMVKNWQTVANGLRLRGNIDVYLTGSNAYMFSSDIANSFGGRYVEIKMQPLSFSEYFSFYGQNFNHSVRTRADLEKHNNPYAIYLDYIHESGFPQVQKLVHMENKQVIADYLMDTVFQNTIQKDIVRRFGIANDNKLDTVIKYLFDNIGRETSLRGIERGLKASGSNISAPTIDVYIKGLLDSFLMYKCERYDIKGKKLLNGDAKYYVVDAGLRYALLGDKDTDAGHILENVVYLELIRRGYNVSVGKIQTTVKNDEGKAERKTIEVDFVATKPGGQTEYYQVAWSIMGNEDVMKREYRSLEQIKDNYPKYLLTMDYGNSEQNGIKRLNVLEWLLNVK